MERFPRLRGSLAGSWHARSFWGRATFDFRRGGFDEVLLKAMVVVCAVWSWRHAAAALLIGLGALLLPGEPVAVKRVHRRAPL